MPLVEVSCSSTHAHTRDTSRTKNFFSYLGPGPVFTGDRAERPLPTLQVVKAKEKKNSQRRSPTQLQREAVRQRERKKQKTVEAMLSDTFIAFFLHHVSVSLSRGIFFAIRSVVTHLRRFFDGNEFGEVLIQFRWHFSAVCTRHGGVGARWCWCDFLLGWNKTVYC